MIKFDLFYLYYLTYILLHYTIILLEDFLSLVVSSNLDVTKIDIDFVLSQKQEIILIHDFIYAELVSGQCSFSEAELNVLIKNLLEVDAILKDFCSNLRLKAELDFFLSLLFTTVNTFALLSLFFFMHYFIK